MSLFRFAAIATLICGLVVGARAEEDGRNSAANPMLLSQSILALRGDERDRTRLDIVFDRTRDDKPDAPLTVWIGADYFAIVDGSRLNITDLRLQRKFVVDQRAQTLVNLSLYADVMFRRVELMRRMQIASAIVKQGGRSDMPKPLDQFWIESELGVLGPSTTAPSMQPHQDGATTQFLHAGQKVATTTAGDTAVPSDLSRVYGAFLRRTLPIHPTIAQWLRDNARVPKQLVFTSEARGKTETIALKLRSATLTSADFPVPEHATLVLLPWGGNDPDVALLRDLLPRMTAAMTADPKDRTTKIAEFRAAIDQDFKAGHKFAAALGLTELAMRWGRSAAECNSNSGAGPCKSKDEVDRLLRDDPRTRTMFKAVALQDKEPLKALKMWQGLDRHDVANAYVVDIFMGRLLSEQGDRIAAAKSFVAAFTGDPAIVALYRELGDHFARVSRLDLAWLCYDMGRALPERRPPDALTSIDVVEQELAEAYPDMF